ncbi:MAG TPA: autoinducer-binding protein, partial [Bradyrhizobium sp.]|nr:autoinducer-binding protein [Bradyrhizobium sp.]
VAEAATFGLKEGFALALPSLDGNLIGFAIAGESLKVDARKRHELRIIATYAVGRALRLRNM